MKLFTIFHWQGVGSYDQNIELMKTMDRCINTFGVMHKPDIVYSKEYKAYSIKNEELSDTQARYILNKYKANLAELKPGDFLSIETT